MLGDETLSSIARELVGSVKRNVTIDWTQRENVRAYLRTIVKRLLRKYGYPPDKQEGRRRPSWNKRKCYPATGPSTSEPRRAS